MLVNLTNGKSWTERIFYKGSPARLFWDAILAQLDSGRIFNLTDAYRKVHPKSSRATAGARSSALFREIRENYENYEEEMRVAAGLDDPFLVKKMVELLKARRFERISDRHGNQDIVDSGPDYKIQGAAMKLQLELQGKIGRGRDDASEGTGGGQKSFTEAIAEQSRLRDAERKMLIESKETQDAEEVKD